MSVAIEDLVQRQASILAELDNLIGQDLEHLANSPLPDGAASDREMKARKLVRALARREIVGKVPLATGVPATKPTIIPAPPGFFVVYLMPLSDGSFDRERVLREPVVGWQVEAGGYVEPLIIGMPVTDRWAVLTPEGFVMTDSFTNTFGEAPLSLKDWIKSEIEWLEGCNGGPVVEFPTVVNRVFEYSGPVANALGLMMAGRRDWTGTLEELYVTLSKVQDGTLATRKDWPADPLALAAAVKALEPKLADADLFFGQTDNGRLLIHRRSGENAVEGSSSSALR